MTIDDIIKGIPLQRLAEICEAERDGRCVALPYPIGTKLFHAETAGALKGHVQEVTLHGYSQSAWQGRVNQGKDARFVICHNSYNEPHAYQLKNLYATRAEAEKALEVQS